MNCRFIYNLRPDTFDPRFRERLNPWGFLLAPGNATPAFRRLAQDAKSQGYKLFIDNGNFDNIGELRGRFAERSIALLEQVGEQENRLGHALRPPEVPSELREAYRDLARDSKGIAAEINRRDTLVLGNQLSLSPSHIIGAEDISMAVWLSLNIEPAYVNYLRRDYRLINERVTRRALTAEKDLPTELRAYYYPVASAVSYNTAFDAGAAFARAGLRRLSMGFGAFMADDNYNDHLYIGRRRIDLPANVPNRYVRTVAVARGVWDGYRHETGGSPEAFHFLGMAAPIMIPLVALCAWGTAELTFDATSPIQDAVQGFFYLSSPAYLKVRARRLALRLAATEGHTWRCPCAFCREFVSNHPFQYEVGRTWFLSMSPLSVTAADLRPGGALYQAYPLLSEPEGGILRQEVNFARIGHNHWVLERILAAVNRNTNDIEQLREHSAGVVEHYANSTSSERFATAIGFSYDLASNTRKDLPGYPLGVPRV